MRELIGVAVPGSGIDLTPAGMPGCSLRVLPILAAPQFPASGPAIQLGLSIPNDSCLLGNDVPIQALVVTPGINAAGMVISNLTIWTIGSV